MTGFAVRVEHLAKEFALGREHNDFPTLRETLANLGRRKPPPSRFWALRDVSFDVRPGEVVGILGSNGAGKSTLLKILSRIVEPTSGRVSARGRLTALLEVGTGFHPELTGRENVFLNGAILGMSRRETAARLDEIVAFSGIEPFIDTPVKRYSSGMYLRLGFAVAAHIEPDILIVDEVLSVGDAAFQAKCMGRMGELVGEGRTVLLVSHQLAAVQKLCTRALLLRDGRVATDGPPAAVIRAYLQGLERDADEPLDRRRQRSGMGAARLEEVRIQGPAGAALVSGEPAVFEFLADRAAPGMRCAVAVFDGLGQGVCSFDTANTAPQDRLIVGPVRSFRCELGSLPLRPGRFRLDAMLTSAEGVVEDHCEGAAFFDVNPGLVDGREVHAQPGRGEVEVPHRWVLG